ncbi:beta-ketoadipate enol-lactone hydrolase [Cystobacter fuscus]|uniref:Beta-ketoadipate enol-lactone hydrolase n=2 Tax=Cystobacter fuscus TaxID=43 RepID=A0A250J293_9BACT|nr:beta-ketoadipate enol-lactone hydrolase [Cystobacter fuscus]
MPMIRLDDLSLHLEESGAGEPVLLLHGLGSSGRDWEFVAPGLATHHRILVPDVRGHGRSDKPAGAYGVPLFARDMAALCARLGVTRVHVVGLSMGGMIGFQLAVECPALVRSLTVINSGPDMVPRTPGMRLMFATRMLLLKTLGPRMLARLIAPKLFPKPEQAELRRRVEESIGSNEPDAYQRATRGLVGWSVLERLKEISCPVLVLASDHDYTPLSAKKAYASLLANARLQELRDSRHAAPIDQPGQILEAVKGFFAEVEGPARGERRVG